MSNPDFKDVKDTKEEDVVVVEENSYVKESEHLRNGYEDFNADEPANIKNHNFPNNLIRKEFCRSVFFLISLQVLTAAIISYVNFMFNNFYPFPLSLCLIFLEALSILAFHIGSWFCFECRLYFPMDFIALMIYTFLEGCFIGSLAFLIQIKAIIWCTYGVSITLLILSVLTETKKFDVTRWFGIAVVFIFLTAICTVFSIVETSHFLFYLYCCIGMLPFPLWVLFDTQLIISRKRRQIDVKDYCYAVLQVNVDITDLLYNFILYIRERRKKKANIHNIQG